MMNTTSTIDKAGRLVVPKELREALHLHPGDTLELERDGDTLVLRPRVERSRMYKAEDGLWVFSSQAEVTQADVDRTLAEVREERERRSTGHAVDREPPRA